jgi:hypothetical protein
MRRSVVLDGVGSTRSLRGADTPRLAAFVAGGAESAAVLPAVTRGAQATCLTGALPSRHGIVANGWSFRDLNAIWLWRQGNRLVQGEKLWDVARECGVDPERSRERPVFASSEPGPLDAGTVSASGARNLILGHVFS